MKIKHRALPLHVNKNICIIYCLFKTFWKNYSKRFDKLNIIFYIESLLINIISFFEKIHEKLVTKEGKVIKNYEKQGTIFNCNSKCYAHFIESPKRMKGGRILDYQFVKTGCPRNFNLSQLQLFDD